MTDAGPIEPRPARRRRGGRIALIAVMVLIALAAAAGIAGWYLLIRAEHPATAGQTVELEVESGSSSAAIAEQLAEAGVVANARMFRLKAHQLDATGNLKSGVYEFTTGMSYEEAIAQLVTGPEIVYYDVTIPEGFTVKQIAARLAEQAGIPEDEFLDLAQNGAAEFEADHPYLADAYEGSLEGYLFPLTYKIKEGTGAREVIEMMLDGFDANIKNVDLTYAEKHNLTLHDVVTIASIIEREVRLEDEYPLVSSVIYNRLRKKMKLQLDSTVFYGLPEGTKVLTSDDLHNGHPYNTYSHYGLPPGALGNPGLKALDAAANPAETDYLYYVLTGKDGSQTFATNYDDFLKAVKKYREMIGVD